MPSKRPSEREYDRFSDQLKDEIYENMDSVKALMACFVVDEKVEFWKKTWFSLEGVKSLVEKDIGMIFSTETV